MIGESLYLCESPEECTGESDHDFSAHLVNTEGSGYFGVVVVLDHPLVQVQHLALHCDHNPRPQDTCFIGEIGLGGELRPVQQLPRRIQVKKKNTKTKITKCLNKLILFSQSLLRLENLERPIYASLQIATVHP